MIELFNIILGVFGYIILGYFINKLKLLPKKLINYFDYIGFNIFLPLALIIYFWQVSFPEVDSSGLMIAFFVSGTIIFFIGFFLVDIFFLTKQMTVHYLV